MAKRCRKIWAAARRMLLRGQERMKAAADRRRRPAPVYAPGQKVWLSTEDLPLHMHSRKLAPSKVGCLPTYSHLQEKQLTLSNFQSDTSKSPAAAAEHSRAKLLEIGESAHLRVFPRLDFIPPEIQRIVEAFTIPPVAKETEEACINKKRGKRGGLRAKLQANPYRPALPSLFLTNTRSLVNKMDERKLRIVSAKIDSCVAIVTETWLDNNIPDARQWS
ncbi:hypothetical protein L3Q82_001999 [Scortum barcoo]|uniref:Uncharacterized protein n=1 Tax=Scortum barcoo TaxID=214431 RepID=A0ACB8W1I2_9TELE|nr:hypothetical protein L3Q82_001999 [Scortum barcoo]